MTVTTATTSVPTAIAAVATAAAPTTRVVEVADS